MKELLKYFTCIELRVLFGVVTMFLLDDNVGVITDNAGLIDT